MSWFWFSIDHTCEQLVYQNSSFQNYYFHQKRNEITHDWIIRLYWFDLIQISFYILYNIDDIFDNNNNNNNYYYYYFITIIIIIIFIIFKRREDLKN